MRTRHGLTLQAVLGTRAAARTAPWLLRQLAEEWPLSQPLSLEATRVLRAARDELLGRQSAARRGAAPPRRRNRAGEEVVASE